MMSCAEQDLNDYFADSILYTLTVSEEKVSVSPIDGNHSITINANTEWSAKTTDEWILIDNIEGIGNSILNFVTKANTTSTERNGRISIYCFGKHKKDIIVQQDKVFLSIIEDTIFSSSRKSEQYLSLKSNSFWKISTSSEWIKVSQKEGIGDTKIVLSVDEHMSCEERLGNITIVDQSSQSKDIIIKQKGKFLNVDVNNLSFLASGENIESVNVDTDGNIEYFTDSWITCTEEKNSILNIKTSTNISGQSKIGTIILNLKDIEDFIPIEISVYQAPIIVNASIVDLGLSVKWASHNIGATNDDEIGGYYLYGEGANYTYKWHDIPYDILPDCVTGTIYDTANSYWGGHWRIPTKEEWNELYNNCTMELIDFPDSPGIDVYNEITGVSYKWGVRPQAYKFTAKNGNYIVLPIAGSWYYYIPNEGSAGDGINTYGMCEYKTATKKDRMVIWSQAEGLSWNYTGWDGWFTSVRAVWDE